jgi:hypothetical protein
MFYLGGSEDAENVEGTECPAARPASAPPLPSARPVPSPRVRAGEGAAKPRGMGLGGQDPKCPKG